MRNIKKMNSASETCGAPSRISTIIGVPEERRGGEAERICDVKMSETAQI